MASTSQSVQPYRGTMGNSLSIGAAYRPISVVDSARNLLAIAKLHNLPDSVTAGIAVLEDSLAAAAVPKDMKEIASAEVINDPVLHAQATIEALARETRYDMNVLQQNLEDARAQAAMVDANDTEGQEVAQARVGHASKALALANNTLQMAQVESRRGLTHLGEVLDAFDDGARHGHMMAQSHFDRLGLWAIAWARVKRWWATFKPHAIDTSWSEP